MTNNKKQNLKIFGMVLGFLWLIIINLGIIMAVTSFFERDTKDEIKLASKDCIPTFDVVYKDGNNETKALLPLKLPNFNNTKFTHKTEIHYEGKLNLKQLKTVIEGNLFMTINPKVVAKDNNFTVQDGLFQWRITVNSQVLINDNKIPLNLNNEIIIIPIKIEIEQLEFFADNIKDPKVVLHTIYDIVDQHGNSFQTAESQINVSQT